MAPEFLSGLMEYDWPGNVRELQNTIERAYYSTIGAIVRFPKCVSKVDSNSIEADF